MNSALRKEIGAPDLGIKSGMLIDGRFQLIRSLDNLRVFLVTDSLAPNKLFAMKIAPKEDIFNSKYNLRREYILHSFFDDPHIVSIKEAIETDEYFGFTMEYVGGGDLHGLLSSKKILNMHEGIYILKGILKGLSVIHEKHIVHADIKPENILITSSIEPKITDFGVAKELQGTQIKDQEIKGTLKYLCPQYARSGMRDTTVDVYAVGLLAYEIFTSKVPLFSEDPVKMFQERLAMNMPSLASFIDQGQYGELIRVIDRSVDRDPKKRFQNAQEFLDALNSINFNSSLSEVRKLKFIEDKAKSFIGTPKQVRQKTSNIPFAV